MLGTALRSVQLAGIRRQDDNTSFGLSSLIPWLDEPTERLEDWGALFPNVFAQAGSPAELVRNAVAEARNPRVPAACGVARLRSSERGLGACRPELNGRQEDRHGIEHVPG